MVIRSKPFFLKVEKPWGYELIFTPPQAPVVGKLLHLCSGKRFSLQYHETKEETLVLIKGEAYFYFGDTKENLEKIPMEQNKGYFIPKRLIHRCEAITECDILESSTREEGITVRLEDDYGRKNETEDERNNLRLKN